MTDKKRAKIEENTDYSIIEEIANNQLIDLKTVILQFSSEKLLLLFGDKWQRILLSENPEKNSEKIKFFLTKIFDNNLKDELVDRLIHTGQDAAALLIDQKVLDLVDLTRCDPRNRHVDYFSFGDENPKDEIKVPKDGKSDTKSLSYDMSQNPKGFCFLLNNYFTKGTYKEMQRFRNIFHQLKFDVIMRKNLDAKDVYKELLMISKSDKLKNHNAFMFMSISHGTSNGELIGFDGKTIKIDKLIDLFSIEKCPDMAKKPRMFFFNCCRGSKSVDDVPDSLDDTYFDITPGINRLSSNSDLFICYSTIEGHEAKVSPKHGTRFGKALADSIVEKANSKELIGIITWTNAKLAEDKTLPIVKQKIEDIRRGFGRQLFFI